MIRRLAAALSLLALPASVLAEEAPTLPLWELGLGATIGASPDYPAASTYSFDGAVFPFFYLRGQGVTIGEDGRALPFGIERVELGVSVDAYGSTGTRTDKNGNTLPDLDATFQVGPELNFVLSETDALFGNGRGRYELALQARGAVSVNWDPDIGGLGGVFRPALRYSQNGALRPGSRIMASIGPIFASESFHEYYYNAPGYDASGGYLGTDAILAVRYPLSDRTNVIGGARLSIMAGAKNEDSPLFKDDITASAFVGLTYSLFQAKRRTTRDR